VAGEKTWKSQPVRRVIEKAIDFLAKSKETEATVKGLKQAVSP
jgi:hypothetical protein